MDFAQSLKQVAISFVAISHVACFGSLGPSHSEITWALVFFEYVSTLSDSGYSMTGLLMDIHSISSDTGCSGPELSVDRV